MFSIRLLLVQTNKRKCFFCWSLWWSVRKFIWICFIWLEWKNDLFDVQRDWRHQRLHCWFEFFSKIFAGECFFNKIHNYNFFFKKNWQIFFQYIISGQIIQMLKYMKDFWDRLWKLQKMLKNLCKELDWIVSNVIKLLWPGILSELQLQLLQLLIWRLIWTCRHQKFNYLISGGSIDLSRNRIY